MSRFFFGVLGLLGTVFLAGCGSQIKPEKVPPLVKVTGKVTLDGKPAEGVAVTFFPAPNNKGNPSSGTVDASGNYTLKYRTGADGIAPGDYFALFSKMALADGSPVPAGKTAADAGAEERMPEKYRSPDNHEMMRTVPKEGATFDFDLTSQ